MPQPQEFATLPHDVHLQRASSLYGEAAETALLNYAMVQHSVYSV